MSTEPDSTDAANASEIAAPPRTFGGILTKLGPGLIIAGSIVGSGELIVTTKTGAEAGFWLLWLIIAGCLIKVFAQVEFGRYAVARGKTTLEGLNEVPGPRLRVNWIVWYWLIMFLFGLAQLGGIIGGVGEALSITAPITSEGRRANEYADLTTKQRVAEATLERVKKGELNFEPERLNEVRNQLAALNRDLSRFDAAPVSYDKQIWAAVLATATAGMLVVGRYGVIQAVATVLVALFTFITVVNVIALQSYPGWAVGWPEIGDGLSFRLPPATGEQSSLAPLTTALAAFGIIGVGATELISYPYWCLEKGYARYTGPNDPSDAWADRARGWLRVLRWDAFCSMFIYTFATVAFYLLGAAVLSRIGLIPDNRDLVRTLGVMYEPVFGDWAELLFLVGAFAVLYSTYFVAIAGHSRVSSDGVRVFGLRADTEEARQRWVKIFCVLFPFISLSVFLLYPNPVTLVLAGAIMQAIMLPMLGIASLYFRFRRCDERLAPGRLWDALLILSAVGLLLAGGYVAVTKSQALWDGLVSIFAAT